MILIFIIYLSPYIQNIIVSSCINEWLYIFFIDTKSSIQYVFTLDSIALGAFCMKCFLSTGILFFVFFIVFS